jgi:hypothetical protein
VEPVRHIVAGIPHLEPQPEILDSTVLTPLTNALQAIRKDPTHRSNAGRKLPVCRYLQKGSIFKGKVNNLFMLQMIPVPVLYSVYVYDQVVNNLTVTIIVVSNSKRSRLINYPVPVLY